MAWLKMVEFPTRLCEVKGELGYFHLWEQWSNVVGASLLRGGHHAGQIGQVYIIVTNAGARISGTGADLVVSSGITMSEEPSYGSDLRIKNSIDYDLASYEAFFLALKPSTFKYNKGTSGRKHFGFIAQDVEQAMLDTGLTSDQLAALVKDPVKEILSDGITDYRYSIRYGELIALNTHMIQKLYQMVEELLQQKEG